VRTHDTSGGPRTRPSAVRDREEAVVARLTALAPSLDGEPDPRFRTATRARLVAMAAVRSPEPARPAGLRRLRSPHPVETPAARWRGRLTAGLAGATVAVTALAGLAGLSTGAQPGDPLYGLKRGTEQTQLALAGDSSRGRTLLDFASTRLAELDHLLAEGTTALPAGGAAVPGAAETVLAAASPELVVETLRTMDAQTADGTAWMTDRSVSTRSPAPLDELLDWVAGQSAGLSALGPEVPEGARDAMTSSLTLLAQVGARGTALQTALTCPAGPATSGTDGLGPRPAPCDTGSSTTSPPVARGSRSPAPEDAPAPTSDAPAPSSSAPASDAPAPLSPEGDTQAGSGETGGGATTSPVPEATGPRPPLPTPGQPGPTPGGLLPTLPIPRPGIPSLPTSTSTSAGLPPITVCLGPIRIGTC
jgi:Domain of unknown function (DUF5667)